MRQCALPALLLAAATLAGCEQQPTEPAFELERQLTTLDASDNAPFASSPSTLPQLFRGAVAHIEQRDGTDRSDALLGRWSELNQEARAALDAGDRATAQARIDALRAEEVRIVLRVLGTTVAMQVVEAVGVDLAKARFALEDAARRGLDVSRANAAVEQAKDLLQRANRAFENADYPAALDHGTQAATLVDGITHFLIGLDRIPGLEKLIADALTRLAREQGIESARATGLPLYKLQQQAAAAQRAGDRERGRKLLDQARAEEIRIVLQAFGRESAARLVEQVGRAIEALAPRVPANDPDARIQRARRMLAEATDLHERASGSLEQGNADAALDLGSHAAGLVNALRHLLPRS